MTRCPVCYIKLKTGELDPDEVILDHSIKMRHPLLQWQKDWRRERVEKKRANRKGRPTQREAAA